MKINWKVRFKNPYFWIGLAGIVCTAMGVDAQTFTTWQAVFDQLKAFINNPFMIGSVLAALVGYITDHTTYGFCDSAQALAYQEPKKCSKTKSS